MDYTPLNGLPVQLDYNCLLPIFKFDYCDIEFLVELHLRNLFGNVNHSPQLTHNVVSISKTSDGGFSIKIG
jgi:hypothetical protein